MNGFHIVKANRNHLKTVCAVENAPQAVSYGALLRDFEQNPCAVYFAALRNGRVIGYLCFWRVLREGQIVNVAVKGPLRRRGVGKALLKRLFAYAARHNLSELTLEVAECNAAAINLYKKLGFVQTGLRRGYYGPENGDALLMNKFLNAWAP